MTKRQCDSLIVALQNRAAAGDGEAQWEIGSWLFDGLRDRKGRVLVHPDPQAAVEWFRRSALLGNACGQLMLGTCLSSGAGVRRNRREALRWLRRALRQNDLRVSRCAPNNIACIYRDRGDNRRALQWYERAVECGDADALVEVGARYYQGIGTTRNPEYGVRCFRAAIRCEAGGISDAGREQAMYHLGVAYRDAEGVRKSRSAARAWFIRANKDDDFQRRGWRYRIWTDRSEQHSSQSANVPRMFLALWYAVKEQ